MVARCAVRGGGGGVQAQRFDVGNEKGGKRSTAR